jgi:hypothetical protein
MEQIRYLQSSVLKHNLDIQTSIIISTTQWVSAPNPCGMRFDGRVVWLFSITSLSVKDGNGLLVKM